MRVKVSWPRTPVDVQSSVRRERDLTRAVSAAQTRPSDRDLAAAQGYEAVLGAVAHGSPVPVVHALRARQGRGLLVQDHAEHLQRGAHGEGHSPSSSSPASSPIATATVAGRASAVTCAVRSWSGLALFGVVRPVRARLVAV